MPRAQITAVDKDARCLDAAIEAGADEVVQCELDDFHVGGKNGKTLGPSVSLASCEKFDLMVLDLCSLPNFTTQNIFRIYKRLLSSCGVYIFTFAYGRDVIEAIEATHPYPCWNTLSKQGATDRMIKRMFFVMGGNDFPKLDSIMTYKGNEMPMCSMLTCGAKPHGDATSFIKVEPGDFEIAVVYPESAVLYDCPRERIESLRRRFAALKAAHTRSQRLPLEES